MSTATTPNRTATETAIPPLVEGQRLDQPTFHASYEAMPPGTRAQLIGGVVFMPSPVSRDHGSPWMNVLLWLGHYEERTRGVEVLPDVTVILDRRNEPQPDALMRIKPEFGGQSRNEGKYIGGPPELLVEVSHSTRYVDLGPKLDEYERAGVLEYVVRTVEPDEVLWHVRDGDRFVPLVIDQDGLYRSRVFPGLWLDPVALLAGDRAAVRAVVDRGLATPEHAAFAARLAAARETF